MIANATQFGDGEEWLEDVQLHPRSAPEVARRVIALILVVDKAFNIANPSSKEWAENLDIPSLLSEQELAFLRNPAPSKQEVVNSSWRSEALVPLVWALGYIQEMPPLNQEISWAGLNCLDAVFTNPAAFVAAATLRPAGEIEDLEAALMHQHWRVRDAQLNDRPIPQDLEASIVYERRYAASWLIGSGENWDEVPTDT